MAFPIDNAHLISHLRSSYLVLFDTDEDAKRILTPNPLDTHGYMYQHIFDKFNLLVSPPIELTVADKSNDLTTQLSKSNRKSRIRHRKRSHDKNHSRTKSGETLRTLKLQSDDVNSSIPSRSISENSIPEGENKDQYPESVTESVIEDDTSPQINYTQTIKKGKKNNLIRMFQRDKGYDSDSSADSVTTTKLNLDTESTPKLQQLDGDENPPSSENLAYLIDGDGIVTPIETEDQNTIETPAENGVMSSDESFDPDQTLDTDFSRDDDSDADIDDGDEDYDFDEEDGEISSDDSAFTDIDGDSLADSPSLLDSFDTRNFSYSKKTKILSSKYRKKKPRSNSVGSMMQSNKSSSNIANDKNRLAAGYSSTTLPSLRNRKPTMKFDKVEPVAATTETSKLSTLIQSRHKSIRTNPLNYYKFVGQEQSSGAIKRVKLDIFTPPKTTPSMKDLEVNNNVSISDCIGFILLKLSELDEYKDNESFSLYPNHWRIELVDEDGENYGSFGILDRSRLLSSYNNPKELAICKVEDELEIRKYEQQSPIPMELKQNLIAYHRSKSENNDLSPNTSIELVSITIFDLKGNEEQMDVSSTSSMGEIINDLCSQKGTNPNGYTLRTRTISAMNVSITSDETLKKDSLMRKEEGRILNKSEIIKDVGATIFEIVPTKSRPVQSLLTVGSDEILDSTISPTTDMNIITPTINGTLGEGINQRKPRDESKPIDQTQANKGKRLSKVSAHEANKYFDDMISNLNSGIPTDHKQRYFTWKVWRKKTTILNKIEKSLIIDGDYIRLQPPEDKAYIMNTDLNPFLASQAGTSHHHRHLHHYNYSNYYNSSMLKTSSFHITQIVKLKQYKGSKNPNHFKIVIEKPGKESSIKKKYDLEAVSEKECEEIVSKIRWVIDMYHIEMSHIR